MKIEKIGDATLYLGDCKELLQRMPDNAANWCVTSPPYNLNKRYSGKGNTRISEKMGDKYESWYADDLQEDEYQQQQKDVLKELTRVCTDSIFYNHRLRYAWHGRNKNAPDCKVYHPMQWLKDFEIWCEIIWDRCGGGNPNFRYMQSHEYIYQINKPVNPVTPKGLLDVWRIPPSKVTGHVCPFPEKLVWNCLSPHASGGESVIDPYMGSGTVGVVAANMGMKFIGCEIDPEYFHLACERISQQTQSDMFARPQEKQISLLSLEGTAA